MGKIKRYENAIQLIRELAEETDTTTEELWQMYEKQTGESPSETLKD